MSSSSMADIRDSHIVEIPLIEKRRRKTTETDDFSVIQQHPLTEISRSPGHLLLLKLWQREEDQCGGRIVFKESQMDGVKHEIFQLSCFFSVFHGLFIILVFVSSISSQEFTCRKWWIPSSLSIITSVVIICSVQWKLHRYWTVSRQLQREKHNNRSLVRCIQELRMKGASFDLSKEPENARRMKSSSVEIKLNPLKWCLQNFVTMCLLCFMGVIVLCSKFILCT